MLAHRGPCCSLESSNVVSIWFSLGDYKSRYQERRVRMALPPTRSAERLRHRLNINIKNVSSHHCIPWQHVPSNQSPGMKWTRRRLEEIVRIGFRGQIHEELSSRLCPW
nr:hypothetical protein CFP56_69523 [Quercus suber]